MMLDQFICMANASLCCFADKNAITKGTLLENIQYFEPTRFMGVTRIFEKIEEGIRAREGELTGLKARVFQWAQSQALHHHKQEESGKPHSSLAACPDSTCLDSSSCVHTAPPQPKPEPQPSSGGRGRARMLHHRHLHESSNQVSSTTMLGTVEH